MTASAQTSDRLFEMVVVHNLSKVDLVLHFPRVCNLPSPAAKRRVLNRFPLFLETFFGSDWTVGNVITHDHTLTSVR